MDDDELRALLAAQSAQIQALTMALGARAVAMSPITFRALWDAYYETIRDASWGKSVRDLMVAPLEHFADRLVGELRAPDWTFYRDHVRKKSTTRFGAAPSVGTRNLELTRTKVMMNWGVAEERISANPFAKVKREPKRPARETTIHDDGLDRLLAAADPVLRAFVLVGVDSGMRSGEVRRLKWVQIGAGGKVTVSWTVAKTKRSRSVRLTARALAAVEALPRTFGGYVFANPETGKPWSVTTLWQRFRTACADASLEAAEGDTRVHYHDTRHTFITRTVERGTPLAVAMRAAGQVTLTQVARYFHLEPGALDDMQARNDAAIAARAERKPPQRSPSVPDENQVKAAKSS